MSTTGTAGSTVSSYATRPINWFGRKSTNYTKSAYERGGWKFAAVVILGAMLVFGFAATLVFGAIGAVLGVIVQVGTLMAWLEIAVAVVGGVWIGSRARSELKEREQIADLGDRDDRRAGGTAIDLLDSGDDEARGGAAYIVAASVGDNTGGVVKQAEATPREAIARLVDLLDDDNEAAQGNAAFSLSKFAYDYPEEVKKHDDALLKCVRKQNTTVQNCALVALTEILGSSKTDESVEEKYLEPISEAAEDPDHEVRIRAADALGNMSDDRASVVLENLRDDSRPEVREAANEVLSYRQGRRSGGSTESAQSEGEGESSDDLIEPAPTMDFSDIAGMDELKSKLRSRVIDPFTGEGAYADFDVGSENGILLHGPPGTGKTHVAKCLAGELDINYLPAGIGSVESKYTGEGVENIKKIFDQAHRNQPVLVFLDEFDALAGDRSDSTQQSDAQKQVNTLLQELSDIDESDDILLVAATNKPDAIDEAMMRTGRFDSKIEVPKPDKEARVAIFQHHLSAPLTADEDLDVEGELARRTAGCSASDMEHIAKQAARIAAKRQTGSPQDIADGQQAANGGSPTVEWADVERAIEEVARESGGVGQFVERPPAMSFDDVAGMDDLKDELREKVIDPLDNPEMYADYGISTENGFVLYGPPGTGKTHMAKALAGELDVNYIPVKASDLVSKWIGEGAENVAAMFDEARANQPCLVFIDEIDALATDRSAGNQQKSERQMVNQFLDEIGSISDGNEDVIVIGATNRLGDVDDAILRSGRLGEHIEVAAPDAEARAGIFEHHLNAPSEGLDLDRIAALTDGFVASDMERLAENAARGALKQTRTSGERTPVTQTEVEDAIDHIRSRR